MSEGTADSPEVASISINVTAGTSLDVLRDEIAALGNMTVALPIHGTLPPKNGGDSGSNSPQFKMPIDLEQTLQKLDQSIVAQTLAIKSMVDDRHSPPGTSGDSRRERVRKKDVADSDAVDAVKEQSAASQNSLNRLKSKATPRFAMSSSLAKIQQLYQDAIDGSDESQQQFQDAVDAKNHAIKEASRKLFGKNLRGQSGSLPMKVAVAESLTIAQINELVTDPVERGYAISGVHKSVSQAISPYQDKLARNKKASEEKAAVSPGVDSGDGLSSPLDPGVAKVKAGYEKLSVDALKMAHGWKKRAADRIIKDFRRDVGRLQSLNPATNATEAFSQEQEIDNLYRKGAAGFAALSKETGLMQTELGLESFVDLRNKKIDAAWKITNAENEKQKQAGEKAKAAAEKAANPKVKANQKDATSAILSEATKRRVAAEDAHDKMLKIKATGVSVPLTESRIINELAEARQAEAEAIKAANLSHMEDLAPDMKSVTNRNSIRSAFKAKVEGLNKYGYEAYRAALQVDVELQNRVKQIANQIADPEQKAEFTKSAFVAIEGVSRDYLHTSTEKSPEAREARAASAIKQLTGSITGNMIGPDEAIQRFRDVAEERINAEKFAREEAARLADYSERASEIAGRTSGPKKAKAEAMAADFRKQSTGAMASAEQYKFTADFANQQVQELEAKKIRHDEIVSRLASGKESKKSAAALRRELHGLQTDIHVKGSNTDRVADYRDAKNLSYATLQASYGLQDFFQVLSQPGMGVTRAFLAAANNLGPAMMNLGLPLTTAINLTTGLLVGTAALNYLMGDEKDKFDGLKDSVDDLNKSFDKMIQQRHRLSSGMMPVGRDTGTKAILEYQAGLIGEPLMSPTLHNLATSTVSAVENNASRVDPKGGMGGYASSSFWRDVPKREMSILADATVNDWIYRLKEMFSSSDKVIPKSMKDRVSLPTGSRAQAYNSMDSKSKLMIDSLEEIAIGTKRDGNGRLAKGYSRSTLQDSASYMGVMQNIKDKMAQLEEANFFKKRQEFTDSIHARQQSLEIMDADIRSGGGMQRMARGAKSAAMIERATGLGGVVNDFAAAKVNEQYDFIADLERARNDRAAKSRELEDKQHVRDGLEAEMKAVEKKASGGKLDQLEQQKYETFLARGKTEGNNPDIVGAKKAFDLEFNLASDAVSDFSSELKLLDTQVDAFSKRVVASSQELEAFKNLGETERNAVNVRLAEIEASKAAEIARKANIGGFLDQQMYSTDSGQVSGKQLNFNARIQQMREQLGVDLQKQKTPEGRKDVQEAHDKAVQREISAAAGGMDRGKVKVIDSGSLWQKIQESLTTDPAMKTQEEMRDHLRNIEALLKHGVPLPADTAALIKEAGTPIEPRLAVGEGVGEVIDDVKAETAKREAEKAQAEAANQLKSPGAPSPQQATGKPLFWDAESAGEKPYDPERLTKARKNLQDVEDGLEAFPGSRQMPGVKKRFADAKREYKRAEEEWIEHQGSAEESSGKVNQTPGARKASLTRMDIQEAVAAIMVLQKSGKLNGGKGPVTLKQGKLTPEESDMEESSGTGEGGSSGSGGGFQGEEPFRTGPGRIGMLLGLAAMGSMIPSRKAGVDSKGKFGFNPGEPRDLNSMTLGELKASHDDESKQIQFYVDVKRFEAADRRAEKNAELKKKSRGGTSNRFTGFNEPERLTDFGFTGPKYDEDAARKRDVSENWNADQAEATKKGVTVGELRASRKVGPEENSVSDKAKKSWNAVEAGKARSGSRGAEAKSKQEWSDKFDEDQMLAGMNDEDKEKYLAKKARREKAESKKGGGFVGPKNEAPIVDPMIDPAGLVNEEPLDQKELDFRRNNPVDWENRPDFVPNGGDAGVPVANISGGGQDVAGLLQQLVDLMGSQNEFVSEQTVKIQEGFSANGLASSMG